MKKFVLAVVASSALSLVASSAFACPEEAGGDGMKKTSEKTKAKPDGAKDTAPKGTADSAGGATQKEASKSADKKPS